MPATARRRGRATGDVVVVADPGDGAAGERAELLAHREQVGQRLARVGVVGQQVDDRHGVGARPCARARRGRRPGRRAARGSRRAPGRCPRRSRGRRRRSRRAARRRVPAELDDAPSRRSGGCAATASRTAAPRPGRRAAGRGRRARPGRAPRPARPATRSSISRKCLIGAPSARTPARIATRLVDLGVGDGERRREPQRGGGDGVDDEARRRGSGGDGLGVDALVELGGEQQAEAAHAGDAGQGGEAGRQPLARAWRARPGTSLGLHDGEHGRARPRWRGAGRRRSWRGRRARRPRRPRPGPSRRRWARRCRAPWPW